MVLDALGDVVVDAERRVVFTSWPFSYSWVDCCRCPPGPVPLMPNRLWSWVARLAWPQPDSSIAWAIVTEAGTPMRCVGDRARATSPMNACCALVSPGRAPAGVGWPAVVGQGRAAAGRAPGAADRPGMPVLAPAAADRARAWPFAAPRPCTGDAAGRSPRRRRDDVRLAVPPARRGPPVAPARGRLTAAPGPGTAGWCRWTLPSRTCAARAADGPGRARAGRGRGGRAGGCRRAAPAAMGARPRLRHARVPVSLLIRAVLVRAAPGRLPAG